jgi:SPP1 family predicted phage head-tail adaptor
VAKSLKPAGLRQWPLLLQRPPAGATRDGDGNYSEPFETFAEVFGSVQPATNQRLERITQASVIGSATHIVTIPFLEGVELQQRVIHQGKRRLDITGFADPDENTIELILVCNEVKQ